MDKRGLAKALAPSLTSGPWSGTVIRTILARRLPHQLQYLVDDLGAELIEGLPLTYSPAARVVVDILVQSDGFDKVFSFCRQHNVWPDHDLSPAWMSPIAAFAKLDVPQLPTCHALAEWLFLPIERLEYLADVNGRYDQHGEEAINHYRYILRPKKSGSLRIIEAPKPHLKTAQRQILHGILDKVSAHSNAFGFVRGRNCIGAAARHAAEQTLLSFDLRDFFPSIGSARVFGLFRCLGYPYEVARTLTGLCTTTTPLRIVNQLASADRHNYRRPHLPQGSPASPALANLTAFTLDRRLSALARSLSANYSRYADDLSFSGDRMIGGTLLRVVPSIVAEEGFHLNTAKTRIASRTSRQIVTGIVVNEHLNVDRRVFDNLKAVIHACGKAGDLQLDDPAFRNSLLGKIGWVEAVNRNRGQKLWKLLSVTIAKRGKYAAAS